MSRQYTASEVAALIGVEARALRRWLRRNPSYNTPGAGGRYSFTDAEIESLKKNLGTAKIARPPAGETRIPVERRTDDLAAVTVPKWSPLIARQAADAERRLMEQVAACGLSVGRSGRAIREDVTL